MGSCWPLLSAVSGSGRRSQRDWGLWEALCPLWTKQASLTLQGVGDTVP